MISPMPSSKRSSSMGRKKGSINSNSYLTPAHRYEKEVPLKGHFLRCGNLRRTSAYAFSV